MNRATTKAFAPQQAPSGQLPRAPSAVMSRAGQSAAKAVGSFVPRLTRKAFEKYGFSAATLLTDWSVIVGPQLAAYSAPDRLKWPRAVESYGDVEAGAEGRPGATLILRVDGGRALDVEYRKRELIERINAYFGYRAVADLRILQAPVNAPLPRAVLTPRAATRPATPSPGLATIANDGLRSALERMEAGIAARRSERR
jgi:hypothetical protein